MFSSFPTSKKLRLCDKSDWNHSTIVAASGVAAFGAVHAVSCACQGALLGLSTGTRHGASSLTGLATIVVASWAAHSTAVCTQQYMRARYQKRQSVSASLQYAWQHRPALSWRGRDGFVSSALLEPCNKHAICVCLVGLVCFKLLGGRFWAIAPSSLTHIGSFARGSIAATEQYATQQQRQAIERLGRLFGCHTCGSRQLLRRASVRFICDHQPPKAVAYQLNQQWWRRLLHRPVRFRFYPQCVSCSNRQGGILSAASFELAASKTWNLFRARVATPSLRAAGNGRNAYMHGLRPRVHFLTGGVLAVLATADTEDQGRRRYQKLQLQLESLWQQPPAQWVQRQFAARTPDLRRWCQQRLSAVRPLVHMAPMKYVR